MIFLDTSFLSPLFAPNDPDHGRVREVMEALDQGKPQPTNLALGPFRDGDGEDDGLVGGSGGAARSGLKAPSPTSKVSSPSESRGLPTKSTTSAAA